MAVDPVERLAFLVVVRRFPCMGAADSRSLRSSNYSHMKESARRSTHVPLCQFLWDVRREFMKRLYVVLHSTLGPIFVMPCRRVVQLLLFVSLLRGLRLVSLFYFFTTSFLFFPLLSL
jgi:hypothetical protein